MLNQAIFRIGLIAMCLLTSITLPAAHEEGRTDFSLAKIYVQKTLRNEQATPEEAESFVQVKSTLSTRKRAKQQQELLRAVRADQQDIDDLTYIMDYLYPGPK